MQKISILFSLLGSMTCTAADVENPLLKGILIVDNTEKVKFEGREDVQGVQFDGVIKDEALTQELTPFLTDLSFTANGGAAICQAITNYYHEHDDLRFAVTLPEQNTSTGVVQVVLAPETLGKVNVKDNRFTQSDTLTSLVRLETADPINEKTLTQDIGWMNTNPYRTVKVAYQNTDKPGVTDVNLVVSDKKNWKVSTGAENTGNHLLGETRVFANFNVNDFIFTDHTLNFKATTSDQYKNYQAYKGEYVAPLPWRNLLKITGSYSLSSYPNKDRHSFDAQGRYVIPQWFGTNPWVDQITYQVGADYKGTNTNVFEQDNPTPTRKELAFVGQFVAGVQAKRDRGSNKLKATFDLIGSPAEMLPHQTAADFNNLRVGATPEYLYSKLALTMEQKILNNWNLFIQGRGQFALQDLVPSEQFALGGVATVRGFDEKVISGDHAVCVNAEIRSPEWHIAGIWLPKVRDKLTLVGFADGGYAWYRTEVSGKPLEQGLLSVGPGLRYAVSSYFTSKIDFGIPLLHNAKISDLPHLHFNASLSY